MSEDARPVSDALLAQAQADEARARRGRLKMFFEADSSRPRCLVTEAGVGYRFVPEREPAPPA